MTEAEVHELSDLNYREALREQSRRCGGIAIDRDGLLLTAGIHPFPTMNTAVRTDPGLDAVQALTRAKRFFAELGYDYSFTVKDGDADRDLLRAAPAAGLAALVSPPAMVVEQRIEDHPLPDGVEVRRTENDEGVGDFSAVVTRAWQTYQMPADALATLFARGASLLAPHIYGAVAYHRGQPVSCALVLLSHGIAGIYWVSTIESARGLGLGEIVTRTVANIGFDNNAKLVSLQASPMGEPIYRRMGFREIFKYQMLVAANDASSGQ